MNNLKNCKYIIETYTDEYKSLFQAIMYKYGDNRERDNIRRTINPNFKRLLNIRYFNKNHKIIYEEKFGFINGATIVERREKK